MSRQSEAELLQPPVADEVSVTPLDGAVSGSDRVHHNPRKKLIRRRLQDRSQRLRHTVQAAFVMLNIGLGIQFCLWTRYYETAGRTLYVNRPAGVEGWLPIAGMMNTKYLLETHSSPQIHPAAMFLFLAVSDRHTLRAVMENRPEIFRQELPTSQMARPSAARIEVCSAGIFRVCDWNHVGGCVG